MVSAEPIVEISHEMETLLRTADRAGGVLSAAAVDLLLRGVRAIEARVDALGRHLPVAPAPVELVEAIAALQVDDGKSRARQEVLELKPELLEKLSTGEQQQLLLGIADGRRAVRADFLPSPQRASEGITITTVRQKTGALGELVKVLPRMLPAADGKPGGLAFVLLLLTSATDAEIEDVRRVSRQTARVVGEQAEALAGVAAASARQTTSFERVAQQFVQQQVASDEVARTISELKGMAREIVGGAAHQAKLATATARDVQQVGGEIAKIRHANAAQTETVGALATSLGKSRAPALSE